MPNIRSGLIAAGAAMLIGGGLSAPPAQAGYIVTLTQQGTSVVATGSGTIDLTDLTIFGSGVGAVAQIIPSFALILTGPTSGVLIDLYASITGPGSFGSGGQTVASSGSGDLVGVGGGGTGLAVPHGYVSGGALMDTATYNNQTFATLGATPGTYEWTWGTRAHADSFTLNIGAVGVPESSGVLLLALPLGVGILLAARQRRATRIARLA